jgi:sirohydrochlorin ferrochelatase
MAQPSGKTAVLLIAHGSRHAPANDDLHQLAARFARRTGYPIVEACFLELAEPDIASGGDRCAALGASRVLMIPYFLAEGVHLVHDLTAARDHLRRRHPRVEFRLGPALGPHPLLDDLVAERIRQTDGLGDLAATPGPDGNDAAATRSDPDSSGTGCDALSMRIDTKQAKG